MIEVVGTHPSIGNVLGDTMQNGFDTKDDAPGLSQFHLEQYIEAFRKIVDATIVSGGRPATRRYDNHSDSLSMTSRTQRNRKEKANRTR